MQTRLVVLAYVGTIALGLILAVPYTFLVGGSSDMLTSMLVLPGTFVLCVYERRLKGKLDHTKYVLLFLLSLLLNNGAVQLLELGGHSAISQRVERNGVKALAFLVFLMALVDSMKEARARRKTS